jgi:hypothetical protein
LKWERLGLPSLPPEFYPGKGSSNEGHCREDDYNHAHPELETVEGVEKVVIRYPEKYAHQRIVPPNVLHFLPFGISA